MNLLNALQARQPGHAALDKLLDLRLQLGLHEGEVVNGADAEDAVARELGADAVHEGPARGAEVVGHLAARGDGFGLAPGGQVVAAAEVLEVGVGHGEVGGEHGGGDFVAVAAVADEGVEETGALGWLFSFVGLFSFCVFFFHIKKGNAWFIARSG